MLLSKYDNRKSSKHINGLGGGLAGESRLMGFNRLERNEMTRMTVFVISGKL